MTTRKTLRTLFLAAVATVGFARSSHAALFVDLRVTGVSGPAFMNNSSSVLVTGVGARIDMEIWARVAWANSNTLDDGLLHVSGSLASGMHPFEDHIRGTMTAELEPAFAGPGSSAGLQQDLDGDGDLDVGSTNQSDATGFFTAHAASDPNPAAGSEFRIGRASFSVESVTSGFAFTTLKFFSRSNPAGATWLEDGVMHTPSTNAFFGGWTVGVSAIPEPAALGLLAAVSTFAAALRPQKKR